MAERTYRINVAAELSGVSVELIRAWERRYGVLAPRRTAAGYRVYTERDVALLRRLRQLTEQGVSIGEAVELLPQLWAEVDSAAGRGAGPVGEVSVQAWQEQVLAAAAALDQERVSAVLDEVLAALPPLKAYEEVLAPLQREVGERWHAGQFTVGQEHLVTQVVRARLISLLHAAPQNGSGRHAVLACLPEEQHEIGLLGAALRLRHEGIRVTLLGQRVPPEDVGRLAVELRADLVGLSAVMDPGEAVFEQVLRAILGRVPEGVAVWVGGAAAQVHRDLCERLGAHVFTGPEDWAKLLA